MEELLDLSKITLNDFNDVTILSHGLSPQNRDYYFHIETKWEGDYAGKYLVLFSSCCEVSYENIADKDTIEANWMNSYNDYLSFMSDNKPNDFLWESNWVVAYLGFIDLKNSDKTLKWSKKFNKEMNELLVVSEIFKLNLVYHSWNISKLKTKSDLINTAYYNLK